METESDIVAVYTANHGYSSHIPPHIVYILKVGKACREHARHHIAAYALTVSSVPQIQQLFQRQYFSLLAGCECAIMAARTPRGEANWDIERLNKIKILFNPGEGYSLF